MHIFTEYALMITGSLKYLPGQTAEELKKKCDWLNHMSVFSVEAILQRAENLGYVKYKHTKKGFNIGQQRKVDKHIKNITPINPYIMATPKKKGKKRVPGKRDKKKKTSNTYAVKAHRYGVTFNTGSPAFYNSPEEMAIEIDGYYEYIKGEQGEREVKVGRSKRKEKYWIREPEPATITGLTLYLGFATIQSLDDYCKKGPKFAEIIKRGKTRVANRYERNLSGDKPTGSIFALKNMGWSDANFFADDGEATVIGFQYIVPRKPKNDEE